MRTTIRFPEDIGEKLRQESAKGIPKSVIVTAALRQWYFGGDRQYELRLPNGQSTMVAADGTTNS